MSFLLISQLTSTFGLIGLFVDDYVCIV